MSALMDRPLFDLDDFDETRVEWIPLYKPFNLAAMVADDRCRDCGVKSGANQGGGVADGYFVVCDDCAALDTLRPSMQPGRSASRWGFVTDDADLDGMRSAQVRRRARYVASLSGEVTA